MRWQVHHIITTSSLNSYVGACIGQTKHVRIHVHLFGGPGKIHMHSSLIRISLNSHNFLFGYLTKLHHYFLSVTFSSPPSSTLFSCRAASRLTEKAQGMSALGQIKGSPIHPQEGSCLGNCVIPYFCESDMRRRRYVDPTAKNSAFLLARTARVLSCCDYPLFLSSNLPPLPSMAGGDVLFFNNKIISLISFLLQH
jgi:hypothetical protein